MLLIYLNTKFRQIAIFILSCLLIVYSYAYNSHNDYVSLK